MTATTTMTTSTEPAGPAGPTEQSHPTTMTPTMQPPARPGRARRLASALVDPRWRGPLVAGVLILIGKLLLPALAGGASGTGAVVLDGIAWWTLLAAAAIAGAPIARRAWTATLARTVGIDLLVTIASIGAVAIGEVWEAAAVTFLFRVGHVLETVTLERTRSALQGLIDLVPPTAILRREDGTQEEVPAWKVALGDTVIVPDGAQVAVDGTVIAGRGAVDEALVTGEPLPREVGPGDRVHAGTTARGTLTVTATGVGGQTTLARIVARVEEAQEARARIQTFLERFSRWYTPGVIVASIVLGLVTADLRLALTLLVISCPGALVISIPVALVAGIGSGARRGVLIRGGEHLEAAARIDAVALDKTGTLTSGKPEVTSVLTANGTTRAEVLALAAGLEASSAHPLAAPVLAAAQADGVPVLASEDVESVPGRGLRGPVELDGRTRQVLVGTTAFMEESGLAVPTALAAGAPGATLALVAADGAVIGALGIEDRIRPDAAEIVAALRRTGVKEVVILTGDRPEAAERIARAAGVDRVEAGLMPEDKARIIGELKAAGRHVAMVGDGVNDAPALAAADIGVAMGAGGSALAVDTADIALLEDSLAGLPRALRLARRTSGVMRQNVVIAVAVVALLIAGVLAGGVTMALGMLVHEVSVLVVIINAMRLLRR